MSLVNVNVWQFQNTQRHNSFMASNTASCVTHAENGSAAFG